MKQDIILAGVGGQGILTIARIIARAALDKGLQVKQAEVHGMSQRGGAVYSHIRLSENPIFSDLIPAGHADLLVAVEPLEALRYAPMLAEGGAVVASANPVANIADYPTVEGILGKVEALGRHVCFEMDRLGRAAGSTLAANVVALGAASPFLIVAPGELEAAIEALFSKKGERFVEVNQRAFRMGRGCAVAYLEGLQAGHSPADIRARLDGLSADELQSERLLDFSQPEPPDPESRLSGAEAHAVESLLFDAYEEGRRQLYEHEVYRILELIGGISPPRHIFVPKGSTISEDALSTFPSGKVVLKLVSSEVVHKSDAGAVVFVPNRLEAVKAGIDSLLARHLGKVQVAGVLVVEFVEHSGYGLGGELFVGIRATREFGPVIAAGLGGLETEYLAKTLQPGLAVAKAVASGLTAERFLEQFQATAAYAAISGQVRGHRRLVSDEVLLRCFRAFLALARHFCVDRGVIGPDVGELEVNPFAFSDQRLVPLDGRGSLRPAAIERPKRSREGVGALIEPKGIAFVGVSSNPDSLGRIALRNTLAAGMPIERIQVVKAGAKSIEGVPCVESIGDLDRNIDLLVATTPAAALADVISQAAEKEIKAAILIPGVPKSESSLVSHPDIAPFPTRRNSETPSLRKTEGGGALPAILGPNCMGVRSVAGRYDTLFIPEDKLESGRGTGADPVALLSQSGAFAVSRMSRLGHLNPAYVFSFGNQADVTVSDLLWALSEREDARVAGIYIEGFADLDGLETLLALDCWRELGRSVVFYKAGRTDSGRHAAAGHTSAVAGDYDICQTALEAAGAMLAPDFRTFGQLLELAVRLRGQSIGEGRILAVTNAGMEAVAIGDALGEAGSVLSLPGLSDSLAAAWESSFANHGLSDLVSPANPLDLTPMASEEAYDAVIRAALAEEGIDAVIVSCVPLAPQLKTLGDQVQLPGAFPERVQAWKQYGKPIVFVVDSGAKFDPLRSALRAAGAPVFDSADEAASRLNQWARVRKRGVVGQSESQETSGQKEPAAV